MALVRIAIFAAYFYFMDKNAVIGLLLIGVMLIAYTYYNAPSEEEIQARKAAEEQVDAKSSEEDLGLGEADLSDPEGRAEVAEVDSAAAAELASQYGEELKRKYGSLAANAKGEEELITLRNEHFEVSFSNKGGVPVKARLLNYKTYGGDELELLREGSQSMGYEFVYPSLGRLHTSEFYFQSSAPGRSQVSGEDKVSLTYTLDAGDGRKLVNTYTIRGNSFDVEMESRMLGMGSIFTEPRLIWELAGGSFEKSIDNERNNSTIFYKEVGKGRDYLSETGDDEERLERRLEWVAFKQNFFSAILMRPEGEEGGPSLARGAELRSRPFSTENDGDSLTQYYFAALQLEDSERFQARLFLGPNDYRTLRSYGMETDKIINLGWGIFGWVNRFLVIPIFDWLQQTGMSYGLIILILTLIIKFILVPLTWKNYLSSARMRVLKPEIDALNEKYKDAEPMKKQQATMELYRKTGVSPFAGCLPMLIQLPILYAMFRFFPNAIQLRHESFLWADDLSSYDSIATLPFSIPAYGDHVSLFTLLMAMSTLAYTVFNSSNMPTQSQPGMPNMKVIMYIFPFMMLFFFNSFASSLSYYYFLANLTSLLQMWFIKRFLIDEEKIKAKIAENKKKRGKMPKSRFQKKLEEMSKQRGIQPK